MSSREGQVEVWGQTDLCHLLWVPHGLLVSVGFAAITLLAIEFEGHDAVDVEEIEPKGHSTLHRSPAMTTDVAAEADFG